MQKYIELRFKKSSIKKFPFFDSWYGFFIWIGQGFKDFAHVEIYFPTSGWSYSSSENDDGERLKRIGYSSVNTWESVRIYLIDTRLPFLTDDEFLQHILLTRVKDIKDIHLLNDKHTVVIKCKSKYDWKGILFHEVIKLNWQDRGKLWCSEACTNRMKWWIYFKDKTNNVYDLYVFAKKKLYLKQ